MALSRFDYVELPNGALLYDPALFGGRDDPALFRSDGVMLVEPGFEFICFNANVVDVVGHLYERGSERALDSLSEAGLELSRRSGLRLDASSCGGGFCRKHLGYNLILDTQFGRPWWSWWSRNDPSDSAARARRSLDCPEQLARSPWEEE